MKSAFVLSPALYGKMLDLLSSLHFTEKLGNQSDMNFFRQDEWLYDTAVIEQVTARKGTWEIGLLFAHHQKPMKFLSRKITSHACPKRANMIAVYMRRQAAKDQRGTLSVSLSGFNLGLN
jgi:hypothetical protein